MSATALAHSYQKALSCKVDDVWFAFYNYTSIYNFNLCDKTKSSGLQFGKEILYSAENYLDFEYSTCLDGNYIGL